MLCDCPDGQLDTMLIIQAVKSRSCLYEREHLRYGDVNYKRVAWEDITKLLFPDVWEKLNDEEKGNKVELVLKRWKNIRVCFSREIKRRKEPKYMYGVSYRRRPYLFYNDLLFLIPENENAGEDDPPGTQAPQNIDLPENNEADNTTVTVDTDIEEMTIPEARPLPTFNTDTNRIKPKTYCDKTKSLPNSDNIKTPSISNSTRSTSNPDTTTNAIIDPDSTHFALSLVPLLNMIPIDERIDAEISVLSVLQPFLKGFRDENREPERDDRKRRLVKTRRTYEYQVKSEASSSDDHSLFA